MFTPEAYEETAASRPCPCKSNVGDERIIDPGVEGDGSEGI